MTAAVLSRPISVLSPSYRISNEINAVLYVLLKSASLRASGHAGGRVRLRARVTPYRTYKTYGTYYYKGLMRQVFCSRPIARLISSYLHIPANLVHPSMTATDLKTMLEDPEIMRRTIDQHMAAILAEERAQRIVQGAHLTQIDKDIARLDSKLTESFGHVERLAEQVRALVDRFAHHADLEEGQWQVVNKANAHLERLSQVLNEHLSAASAIQVRVSNLERVLYGLAGMIATMIVAAAPVLLNWWLK
jgi:uncharacterized coiled-coil protein SlyX